MKRSWICDWFVLGGYHSGRMALLIILFILLWCVPMDGFSKMGTSWASCLCPCAPVLVMILEGVLQVFTNKRWESQNFGRLFLESTALVLVLYLVKKAGLFEVAYAAGFTLVVWLVEICTGYINE